MSQTVRNNFIRELPKLELHCHLDGSLTQKSIEEIMERPVALSELQVEPDCRNLAEYLQKFDLPIQCLQTREGIKKASKEFLLDVAKENVRYMEVRFAPTCSINDHMTYRDVMEATLDGLEEARKECGTYYNVIVCCMRHFDLETNLAMLKGCREFLGAGVCAADLAGDETSWAHEPVQGIVPRGEEAGLSVYHSCRRMWKRSEYHRCSGCRSSPCGTWNCHERIPGSTEALPGSSYWRGDLPYQQSSDSRSLDFEGVSYQRVSG